MFVYTVYPRVQGVNRVDPYRAVERASAVNAVRAVENTWNSQFSEAVHTRRRAYEAQSAGRVESRAMKLPQTVQQSARVLEPMTSEASSMQIQGSRQTMLAQRGTKTVTDGEYIRKYVQQLNEARDRTIRQRRSDLQARELRQNHGAAKSVLLS